MFVMCDALIIFDNRQERGAAHNDVRCSRSYVLVGAVAGCLDFEHREWGKCLKSHRILDVDICLRKRLGPCAQVADTLLVATLVTEPGSPTYCIRQRCSSVANWICARALVGMPIKAFLANDAAFELVTRIQGGVER